MEDCFNYVPDPRMSKSASETLSSYINDYDSSRRRFGTCSFNSGSTRENCSKMLNSLRNDMSALDEEILMARNLFPDERHHWGIDDLSMTTEELLMEQPLNTSFCSSSSESMSYSGCNLRVSDLGGNYGDCAYFSRKPSNCSVYRPTTTDTDAHSNLTALQQLFDREKMSSRSDVQSLRHTPVAKVGRSKITSEHLQGELKVSINCDRNKSSRLQSKDYVDYEPRNLDASADTSISKCNQRRCDNKTNEKYVSVALQLEGKPTSVREFMGECFVKKPSTTRQSISSAEKSAERTVESLKKMLFTLQEISSEARSELGKDPENQNEGTIDQGYESLERAMEHLSILKSLVKEVGGSGLESCDRGFQN